MQISLGCATKCLAVLTLLTAVTGSGIGMASPRPSVCDSCSGGVDSSLTTSGTLASYLGKAICQVFEAPDSLLSAFTVWRIPDLVVPNTYGMHLYITEVDSSGTPDVARVVLDGPTLVLQGTSAAPRAVKYRFEPPLSLPHRGKFAASIKEEDPFCAGGFSLLADSTESYPCGEVWRITPFASCVGLGASVFHLSGYDLAFQVQFACTGSTAVLPTSWGSLKARYR